VGDELHKKWLGAITAPVQRGKHALKRDVQKTMRRSSTTAHLPSTLKHSRVEAISQVAITASFIA